MRTGSGLEFASVARKVNGLTPLEAGHAPSLPRHRRGSTFLLLLLLLFSGCAHFPRPGPTAMPVIPLSRSPWSAGPELCEGWEIAGQYAYSTAPRIGYNTFEVYLTNLGGDPVSFKSASLDGTDLPMPEAVTMPAALKSVSLEPDSKQIPLPAPASAATRDFTWWQFYPCAEASPGETVVFQVNFKKRPSSQQKLTLTDSDGQSIPITVPRFRQPEKLITAVTYSLDYNKVYIQYQSKTTPQRLWINNHEVTDFTHLNSPEPRTPNMLAMKAPFPITTGMPLHVKILFDDGNWRHGLVRALNSIMLDAYGVNSSETRRKLGLDSDSAVQMVRTVGGDVACCDTEKGKDGYYAPAIVAERGETYHKQKHRLTAIHYCTAMYPELWNIYGSIVDAVFANPYRLSYGHNPGRFIEEEENSVREAWLSARPRPFLWIPEAYKVRDRFLEGEELEVLGWMALVRGCKGINYYTYQFGNNAGFGDCPPLLEAIKDLNREVRAKQKLLSPVAFVSERTISHQPSTISHQPSPIKVYTAWAGDQGILAMVRNLNYQTDAQADNMGKNPRFQITPIAGLTVPVSLPEWFQYCGVRDFLSGKRVPAVQGKPNAAGKQRLEVSLANLHAFKLLWLENEEKKPRKWYMFWKLRLEKA